MTTYETHPRYREIQMTSDHIQCPPGTPGQLSIILFSQDAEFRSHAVKHLLNLQELETVWKGLLAVGDEEITRCISDLQHLGCPSMAMGLSRPPCKGCRIYYQCTEWVAPIEKEYLRIVQDIITDGGRIPRYACFYSDAEGYSVFCVMPDRPVILKASVIDNRYLNLMTCYGGANLSFSEMRHLQVDKIMNEARRKNIIFRNEATWGIESPVESSGDRKPGKSKKKRKKRKARNVPWRKYLDDLDELDN